MTDLAALVAEVKAALQQASKGPWTLMPIPPASREDHGWRSLAKGYGWMVGIPRDVFLRVKGGIVHRKEAEWKADLDLVAHAPEWLGALVQAVEDQQTEVSRLRADGQRLEERIKTARKFVLSAVGNLAEQNWEMCENELGAVLAALTTSDLGGDAP